MSPLSLESGWVGDQPQAVKAAERVLFVSLDSTTASLASAVARYGAVVLQLHGSVCEAPGPSGPISSTCALCCGVVIVVTNAGAAVPPWFVTVTEPTLFGAP